MNYALAQNRDKWLRHPAMGDPSFDTFERTETVHRSDPPYEWAVNGSLFKDKDGRKYLYAGLYGLGYQSSPGTYNHFEIYRQSESGWENLGPGLDKHYMFEGEEAPSSACPDAVVFYDKKRGRYLLTYDWGTENESWDNAYDSSGTTADSGAAVAWGDTPAGPFERIAKPVFRNKDLHGKYGRFLRFYATTVIPRENDYLALILCDSAQNFAWGLAASIASKPEEGFTAPEMILSADRSDYFPAPMEFYPAFVIGDVVYAPATSVCANRNYQVIFAARLEEAHKKDAWSMVFDGSVWHSRPVDDEYYGIWGQTISGSVDSDGIFSVVYPSRDRRGYGTLSTAERRWTEPYSDGFTISGHSAPSVSVLRDSYRTFDLEADLTVSGGFADIIFDFRGKIGADSPTSDCSPRASSLTDYSAVRIEDTKLSLTDSGKTLTECETVDKITTVRIRREEDRVKVYSGNKLLLDHPMKNHGFRPVGIRTDRFTVVSCARFQISGNALPSLFVYSDTDALLGGGVGECNFRTENGFRFGKTRVKWNAVCGNISIIGRRFPGLGSADVRVDGRDIGGICFAGDDDGISVLMQAELPYGPHGIEIIPRGEITIPELIAEQK